MVTVIGNDLKDQFFANTDPIGKSVMVEGRPFEVDRRSQSQGIASSATPAIIS